MSTLKLAFVFLLLTTLCLGCSPAAQKRIADAAADWMRDTAISVCVDGQDTVEVCISKCDAERRRRTAGTP